MPKRIADYKYERLIAPLGINFFKYNNFARVGVRSRIKWKSTKFFEYYSRRFKSNKLKVYSKSCFFIDLIASKFSTPSPLYPWFIFFSPINWKASEHGNYLKSYPNKFTILFLKSIKYGVIQECSSIIVNSLVSVSKVKLFLSADMLTYIWSSYGLIGLIMTQVCSPVSSLAVCRK